MSRVLAALKKRAKYPVDINGDTCYVRALRPDEIDGLKTLSGEALPQCAFLACSLVDEDGAAVIERQSGESFADFAQRAVDAFDGGVPMDVFHQIRKAVEKATNPPNDEVLKGNS